MESVEYGGDVDVMEAGDMLMDGDRDLQFIVQRNKQSFCGVVFSEDELT